MHHSILIFTSLDRREERGYEPNGSKYYPNSICSWYSWTLRLLISYHQFKANNIILAWFNVRQIFHIIVRCLCYVHIRHPFQSSFTLIYEVSNLLLPTKYWCFEGVNLNGKYKIIDKPKHSLTRLEGSAELLQLHTVGEWTVLFPAAFLSWYSRDSDCLRAGRPRG
jgi:hypothetical protein